MEIHEPTSEAEFQQLFQEACTHHEQGNFEKAEKLYTYLLNLLPDVLIINYNYGLLLLEHGLFERACHYYQKAAKSSPENNDVLYNYALCLKQCGNFEETITIYKKILSSSPDDVDSHYNLGCCYKDIGESQKAIASYHNALRITPDHHSSLNNIAYLYHRLGDLHHAKKYYEHLISLVPNHKAAKHMLASLNGESISTTPKEYVEEIFDTYSENYEQSLVNDLQYNVPNLMHTHFQTLFPTSLKFSRGLDLGCGTGLAALAFSQHCRSLTGVDLSGKMLLVAEKKGVYDELIQMDILEFLLKAHSPYDIIIAADVFTYLGELEAVFDGLQNSITKNTILCFTTEFTDKKGYELRKTGRFAHSQSYVKKLAEENDWTSIGYFEENLRKEKEEWIKGSLFFFQRK